MNKHIPRARIGAHRKPKGHAAARKAKRQAAAESRRRNREQ